LRTSLLSVISTAAVVTGVTAGIPANAAAAPPTVSAASPVNPLIGTGSAAGTTTDSGHTNPGPDMPFGMIQLGPDTWPTRVNGGGYWYDSSQLLGFSLDRLSGAGCPVYGDVPILPMVGAVPADPGAATVNFSHASESAQTGYYRVTTTGPGASSDPVTTQLTDATRSGLAEFIFPASTQSDLLLKVADSAQKLVTVNGQSVPKYQKVFGTAAQVAGDDEVTGSVTAGNFCNTGADAHANYTLHFDIKFDQPFTASGTWPGGPGGDPGGISLTFDTTRDRTVTAKVGISYTSGAGAAQNLATEIPGWDFGAVRNANARAWNRLLGRVQLTGGAPGQQAQFYTALYHALLDPHVYSDVNGQYMGMDGKVHTAAAGHAQYADYSGWDIYRSQVQLLALLDPGGTSDIVQSMLNDYAQDGMLPKWAQGNSETYEMSGDPADPIIADAYAFGARDFDTRQALDDMIAEATKPNNIRPGQSVLGQYGYLPSDLPASAYGCCSFADPVSTQLEYDTADYAIAAFAKALHDQPAYTTFATRAQDWQNVFNPATGYVQEKLADGRWAPGFTPGTGTGFVEGTAAQYTPMIPFNLSAVIAARGGPQAWQGYLDSLLANLTSPGPTNAQLNDEPSMLTPWEYDYGGQPWKTQQVVRQVQSELYADTPAGEPGNDDLGTFSAWYVWSELGLYPATPGTGTLVIGSPVFPRAVIRLAGGRNITINAPNAAADAPYVQNLQLNRRDWDKTYLAAGQYRNGATLTFSLATTPDTSWGTGPSAAPPSDATGEAPAIPYLPTGQVTIGAGQSTTVTLKTRNVTSRPVTVAASGAPPTGITVSPGLAPIRMAAGGQGQATLTVQADASRTPGTYQVPISLHGTGRISPGTHQPTVVLTVNVVSPTAANQT
jgi:predicted alpha-1,2-mannosidase